MESAKVEVNSMIYDPNRSGKDFDLTNIPNVQNRCKGDVCALLAAANLVTLDTTLQEFKSLASKVPQVVVEDIVPKVEPDDENDSFSFTRITCKKCNANMSALPDIGVIHPSSERDKLRRTKPVNVTRNYSQVQMLVREAAKGTKWEDLTSDQQHLYFRLREEEIIAQYWY